MQPSPFPWCSLLLLLWVLPVLVCGTKHGDVMGGRGDVRAGEADRAVWGLQEAFFQWAMATWPSLGTQAGNRTWNDRLHNASIPTLDSLRDGVAQFRRPLESINRKELSRPVQYSYDIFMDTLRAFPDNYVWRNYGALNPINFLEGFYLEPDSVVNPLPFLTKADFLNYLARLRAFPEQINQMMSRMNKSIELKTTYHNVSMVAVPDQIAAVTNMSVEDSPFFGPFKDKLDSLTISEGERQSLRSRAREAMEDLWAALRQLKTYIQNTYLANTRTTYGVDGLPAGRDYYRACLKWHLSVDLTPQEVHHTGLREVTRITQRMTQIMKKEGFYGTVRQYYNRLNRDPRFQMNSAEEILQAYRNLIKRQIYPKLPPFFKNIPDLPVEVRPMPFDGPGGMYYSGSEDGSRPGIFYANVFRVNDTKTFTMPSLTLHETVPGHHLTAIYSLAGKLPRFQKYTPGGLFAVPYGLPFYTAFEEGWALYAEYLGEEMKVYRDDFEMMGRYADEMLRAVRLVVDTGMHYFGWSRERAIRYLYDRTPMSRTAVEIEIDRYLTWPGQACAYKIGELKIKELRQRAETALGGCNFDIRDFHYALVTKGRLPLSTMETVVEDYIAHSRKQCTSTAPYGPYSTVITMATYLLTSLVIIVIHH